MAEHLNKVIHRRGTASMTIMADKTRDMEIAMARTEDSLATAVVTTTEEEVEVIEETEGVIVVRLAVDAITILPGVPVVVMVAIKDLSLQRSISKDRDQNRVWVWNGVRRVVSY